MPPRSKRTAETTLKKDLTDALTKMGIRWFRMQSGMLKKGSHHIRMNKKGTPDLLLLIQGKALWIEVKKPGEKPTPDQISFMEDAIRSGEKHLVVDSLDGMIAGLRLCSL